MGAIQNDPLGTLVPDGAIFIAGAAAGPLSGLSFAVKDAIDLAGYGTGAGNPDWLRTHPPATANAPAVQALLDAGASVVGKVVTDELTFSLNGENIHYGTPLNLAAPDRIPGGSSSGSAAAVAGGLVDFAIGTDCGGSVRAPASYCGIFGIRPTHGRVSTQGVFRLAPSFDTVGWFARDAQLLELVGRVLLDERGEARRSRRLLIAADAFAWAGEEVAAALSAGVERLRNAVGDSEEVTVAPHGFGDWLLPYRVLQGAEIWAELGPWITEMQPNLAPDIRERFDWTATITAADVAAARPVREQVRARMQDLLAGDAVLCMPTVRGIPPLRSASHAEKVEFRGRALSLLCIAGMAGLPQINLPIGTLDGCPCGLSIVGARGSDLMLLRLASNLSK